MANLTLKNIPDDLYERLKTAAKRHHRSINSELIHCLEIVFKPKRVEPGDRIARARELRTGVDAGELDTGEIASAIREGRP
jgi:antitoxin FitA